MGLQTPQHTHAQTFLQGLLKGRKYHAARLVLFVLACLLISVAIFMLSFSNPQASRTQQLAANMIQTEARAEVLLIASYDDAVAGKITSKDDDSFTRSNPNFTAYKEEGSSLYKMQVSTGTLMVVVVDRVDRLYAYTKKEVDLEGAPPTFSVLFRPWVQQWIDTEEPDGWVVVNPALDPDPDKDSQTQTQPRRR